MGNFCPTTELNQMCAALHCFTARCRRGVWTGQEDPGPVRRVTIICRMHLRLSGDPQPPISCPDVPSWPRETSIKASNEDAVLRSVEWHVRTPGKLARIRITHSSSFTTSYISFCLHRCHSEAQHSTPACLQRPCDKQMWQGDICRRLPLRQLHSCNLTQPHTAAGPPTPESTLPNTDHCIHACGDKHVQTARSSCGRKATPVTCQWRLTSEQVEQS